MLFTNSFSMQTRETFKIGKLTGEHQRLKKTNQVSMEHKILLLCPQGLIGI